MKKLSLAERLSAIRSGFKLFVEDYNYVMETGLAPAPKAPPRPDASTAMKLHHKLSHQGAVSDLERKTAHGLLHKSADSLDASHHKELRQTASELDAKHQQAGGKGSHPKSKDLLGRVAAKEAHPKAAVLRGIADRNYAPTGKAAPAPAKKTLGVGDIIKGKKGRIYPERKPFVTRDDITDSLKHESKGSPKGAPGMKGAKLGAPGPGGKSVKRPQESTSQTVKTPNNKAPKGLKASKKSSK